MLIALEILLLAYVAFRVWRIMRNTFRLNVLLVGAFLVAAAAAYLVGWLSSILMRSATANILIGVGVSAAFSTVAYILLFFFLGRLAKRKVGDEVNGDGKRRGAILCGRSGNLLLSALLVVTVVLVLDLLVGIASVSDLADIVADRTLLIRHLLPQPLQDTDRKETDEEDLAEIMDRQAEFMESFRTGFQASKEKLAEKVGTLGAVQQARSLVTLLNLPPEDSAWLIANTPELKSLQDNANVRAILENDEVIDLVIEVGEGSMGAVYRLSEHPALKNLVEDKQIIGAMKRLDLVDLEKRAHSHQGTVKDRMKE